MSLLQLTNPATTASTDAFKIQIYDQEFLMMESDTVTISAEPGTLTNCQITPDNYRTRKASLYSFSFGISNTLESGSSIQVKIPSTITVDSSSLTYSAI